MTTSRRRLALTFAATVMLAGVLAPSALADSRPPVGPPPPRPAHAGPPRMPVATLPFRGTVRADSAAAGVGTV